MPQDIPISLPFQQRISPDVDGARERAVPWARRHGLITGPVDERRFVSWDMAGLMARWAPLATGTALDMVVDAVNVATMLDDQFDGPLADKPDQVARACADFHAVVRAETPRPGAGPLSRAFADVWTRLRVGRSAYWRDREAAYWSWYFDAYVEETRDRALNRVLPRDEFFTQRHKSGLVYPMLGMTESAYGFEVTRRTGQGRRRDNAPARQTAATPAGRWAYAAGVHRPVPSSLPVRRSPHPVPGGPAP